MQNLEKFSAELEGIDIRFNEPLSQYTYTKVGGAADFLVFPRLGWCLGIQVILLFEMAVFEALSSCLIS